MDTRVFVKTAGYGNSQEIGLAVEDIFAQLPAAQRLCGESRVLIKPNLLAKHAPEKAVTTHPHVLRGVILALQKRGVKDIMVADSPGGLYTESIMRALYKESGLAQVCQELGVKLYTACESSPRKTQGHLVKEFNLIAPVHTANFIVNLPKLKTHVLTVMSGAVKNLFGCIPGLQKAEYHTRFPQKEHFAQMLVDLCQCINADIHIVDGTLGMQGDGPAGGSPRVCNLLFAGENPYLLDLALCYAMGIGPMQTPVLHAAAQRGLCETSFSTACLVGDAAGTLPLEEYILPRSYGGKVDFSGSLPRLLRPAASALIAKAAPRPAIKKTACIGCAKCAQICPQKVIEIQNQKAKINYRACIRCFCCHEICPVQAIAVKRNAIFKR